ncbi:DNA repair exonuclease SbcCD ATPase subunit [Desulfohalotomaculum tongense]|uniref:hypothetical protein n=1 Tax=Desulforadius tongensis TaxID=1216062 RepID=UPI00195DE745|nr:hypothetical protein [Desulforadius tongensis]MBM7855195.1 DNA repair exonuclease SbcCD ATPase subunit [Desulforadius tongensis]
MASNQAKVEETLDRLMNRIDSYQREKNYNLRHASAVYDRLDKLVQTMARLEAEKSEEVKIAAKIEEMTKQIDKILKQQQKKEKQMEFEETLRKILHGAKITGKVIETFASSADLMFETIARLIKEEYKGGAVRKQKEDDFDLAALLKPLNSLIQGFASIGSGGGSDSGYSADSKEEEDKDDKNRSGNGPE